MNSATTRDQLLDHAQCLIRRRGYNGFSYRDLAEHVGVKTASIHYYFPAKDDLLIAVIDQYTAKVHGVLTGIDSTMTARARLNRYIELFESAPPDQICLCGMLAADVASLSERARQSVQAFFRIHENWLADVITAGVQDGTLSSSGDAAADGRWLFAAIQGAIVTSRLFQDPQRLRDVFRAIQCQLSAGSDCHSAPSGSRLSQQTGQ
ncbi:TetR/AcrR family transcriptional regulator [Bordetella sp. 02P26C-1]|uniref:TetR/AcrR family transcriptional regulator n=1 Tax=Bordetella sp. 02P26C-1 TaxID=2683195 RepID=UPI001355231D|nr:TetR/AcrR family transcriptional regulator [Bordetella sp. 02P26C-1]MVW78267.1 TetR family transcriptional regulator [Bordetella sp. 02P26C-1]